MTHPGETYANVAGSIFGRFEATADTTEPDWLPLSFRVSLFVTHILAYYSYYIGFKRLMNVIPEAWF